MEVRKRPQPKLSHRKTDCNCDNNIGNYIKQQIINKIKTSQLCHQSDQIPQPHHPVLYQLCQLYHLQAEQGQRTQGTDAGQHYDQNEGRNTNGMGAHLLREGDHEQEEGVGELQS